MGWIPMKVTVDEGRTVVEAEVRDDYRWNGWLCPRMRYDQAVKALRGLEQDEHSNLELRIVRGQFNGPPVLVLLDHDRAEDEQEEQISADFDGWYAPGHMGWCWEDAQPFIDRAV